MALPKRISLYSSFLLCGLASIFGFLGGLLASSHSYDWLTHPFIATINSAHNNDHNDHHHSRRRQQQQQQQNLSLIIPDRPTTVPMFETVTPLSHTKHEQQQKQQYPNQEQQQQQQQQQLTYYYTEFLVHPALLVHPNPQHVAISTNDWDSAQPILKQVQKHPSVTQISVLLVDYSSYAGAETCPSSNAQDHSPKIQVYPQELQVVQNSGDSTPLVPTTILAQTVDVFLLDETSAVLQTPSPPPSPLSTEQENNIPIWKHLLHPIQGILVVSLPTTTSMNAIQRVAWIDRMLVQPERSMFEVITDYDSFVPRPANNNNALMDHHHCCCCCCCCRHHQHNHHHFAVAFVHRSMYAHWHVNEADFTYRLRQRHISVQEDDKDNDDDKSIFLIAFDGAIMASSLRFPSRISETAFCTFAPDKCGVDHPMGIDLYAANIPRSQLQVKQSSVGDYAGRGVFTQVDIPANSYLDLESASYPIRVSWKASKIIWDLVDTNEYFDEYGSAIHYYLEGYGYADEFWGLQEEVVDSSLLAFINHGCNSTYNIGLLMQQNEFEVDPDNPPKEMDAMYYFNKQDSYNPRQERNKMMEQTASITCKAIKAGEELLENYLTFGGLSHFKTQVSELRAQCRGASGLIERYQDERQ